MATKLDKDFVAHIKKSHANSLAGINALAAEVIRLESQVDKLESALKRAEVIARSHGILWGESRDNPGPKSTIPQVEIANAIAALDRA